MAWLSYGTIVVAKVRAKAPFVKQKLLHNMIFNEKHYTLRVITTKVYHNYENLVLWQLYDQL